MLKGEIVSVVWHEHGHRIEVHYLEGGPDYMEGEEHVVSEMAADEGMHLVVAAHGTRRWERP